MLFVKPHPISAIKTVDTNFHLNTFQGGQHYRLNMTFIIQNAYIYVTATVKKDIDGGGGGIQRKQKLFTGAQKIDYFQDDICLGGGKEPMCTPKHPVKLLSF